MEELGTLHINPTTEARQKKRLAKRKAQRQNRKAGRKLNKR